MNQVVVTTIFPPTPALAAWRDQEPERLVVVGDRKTPSDWNLDKAIYLSPEAQTALPFRIQKHLPWNHYSRKMIGYLVAMSKGASRILDTDDDNFPLTPYPAFPSSGSFPVSPARRGFINIYRRYCDQFIWPRGFPLNRIREEDSVLMKSEWTTRHIRLGIWQGLVNGDPDVDAIYRLAFDTPCIFRNDPPIVLDQGTFCPFNSQNTLFFRNAFPLLYLPSLVSFRFTDILRGLVAQPILWAAGMHLGFSGPTAFQKRNPHDYLTDFASEIPVYLHAETAARIAESAVTSGVSMADNLFSAYRALRDQGLVPDGELELVEAWLADCQQLG